MTKNNIYYTVELDEKTKVEVVKLPAENLYKYSVAVKWYSEQFDTWKLEEETAEYEPRLFETHGEVYGHIEYLKLVHSNK